MSWQTVFRDDLLGVRRSRLGFGVAATVFVFTGGIALLVMFSVLSSPGDAPAFDVIMLTIGSILSIILPFIAMMASYNGIIHERETGSVRFLLGLPNSRFDAYVGKYLSRGALLTGATVAGMIVTVAIGVGLLTEPMIVEFVLFTLLTILYGLLFLGIGLAASGYFDSETQVTAGIISTYVLFRGVWPVLQWGLLRMTQPEGERFVQPHPEWYYFLGRLDPMNGYVKLVNTLFGSGGHPLITNAGGPETSYLAVTDWYALLAMVAWFVGVPVLGYLAFERRDIL